MKKLVIFLSFCTLTLIFSINNPTPSSAEWGCDNVGDLCTRTNFWNACGEMIGYSGCMSCANVVDVLLDTYCSN